MEASQIINVTSQIHSHLHYYWSCPKHPGAVLSTHTHTTCHTYSQSFQNLVNKITLTTSTSDQLLIFCTDLWPSWWRGPPPCHPWPAPRPLCASVPDHCFGRCYVPSGCWPPVQTPEYVSHHQQYINNCKHLINWHSENQHRTFCNLKQNEALSTHPEWTKRIKQQGQQQPRPDSPTVTVTLMTIQCPVNHDGSVREKMSPGML